MGLFLSYKTPAEMLLFYSGANNWRLVRLAAQPEVA